MPDTITSKNTSHGAAVPGTPRLCKELRLGLVCYGGVSLAVYMHGIAVELQHLVVASAVFCANPDSDNPFRKTETSWVYWEALRSMALNPSGDHANMRVVVDVIAGTSAGGINGTVLAKALVRGLRQDPLRTVWFDNASLLKLLMRAPWPFSRRRATSWAPLNGERMSRWAYQALTAMNREPVQFPAAGLKLVPPGNELDLFVTTTDCVGFRRTIDMSDPAAIHDLEYRHVLRFHYDPSADDTEAFASCDDRMLTLAARSTSSFPGAFPPVTLGEIEAVAGKFSEEELKTHFTSYLLERAAPCDAFFLDGGVLNNHPFDHAIEAILERSADRQVERRLLFIEPHPVDIAPDRTTRPGWLRTIGAALSGIPRHQPIADALTALAQHNQRALEIRQLIALTEPSVADLIVATAKKQVDLPNEQAASLNTLTLDQIDVWVDAVGEEARAELGVCYGPYEAIKVGEVLRDIGNGICKLFDYPADSRLAALVQRIVDVWARGAGLTLDGGDRVDPLSVETDEIKRYRANAEARQTFLKRFDMNFRARRLRFVIRCINEAYSMTGNDTALRPTLDAVKAGLYDLIRTLRHVRSGAWVHDRPVLLTPLSRLFGPEVLQAVATKPGAGGGNTGLEGRASHFVAAHGAELDTMLDQLGTEVEAQLKEFWKAQDDALRQMLEHADLPPRLLHRMLSRYIGFTYWDAILYPLIAMSRISEPDLVEVVRISPNDATMLSPLGVENRLKGVRAFNFGAFLKRRYRVNDFVWGRLDAVERLLCVVGGISGSPLDTEQRKRLAWQGFEAVLKVEGTALKGRKLKQAAAEWQAQVELGLSASRQAAQATAQPG